MTWETNCVTFVRCDDPLHGDDPVSRIETGFDISCGQALAAYGWSYSHDRQFHRCPICTQRHRRSN